MDLLTHTLSILKSDKDLCALIGEIDFFWSPCLGKTNGNVVLGLYSRKERREKMFGINRPSVNILKSGDNKGSALAYVILHEIGHHVHWSQRPEWSLTANRNEKEFAADSFAYKYLSVYNKNV